MIKILDQEFKSQVVLRKYVRKLLNCYSIIQPNIYAGQFLLDLIKRHPNYPEKLGPGISCFTVTKSTGSYGRDLFIHRTDGTVVDISWNRCIAPNRKKDYITPLFRKAIVDQILEFSVITPYENCPRCSTQLHQGNSHIDHVIPFSKLLKDFQEISMDMNEWVLYHKKHAILQRLCIPCNSKKGSTHVD